MKGSCFGRRFIIFGNHQIQLKTSLIQWKRRARQSGFAGSLCPFALTLWELPASGACVGLLFSHSSLRFSFSTESFGYPRVRLLTATTNTEGGTFVEDKCLQKMLPSQWDSYKVAFASPWLMGQREPHTLQTMWIFQGTFSPENPKLSSPLVCDPWMICC